MTLLDAQPYDLAKLRRRKIKITVTIVVVLVLAALAWMYRNWPEEHSHRNNYVKTLKCLFLFASLPSPSCKKTNAGLRSAF